MKRDSTDICMNILLIAFAVFLCIMSSVIVVALLKGIPLNEIIIYEVRR